MLESQLLSWKLLAPAARDRNRRRVSRADDPEIGGPHLDLPGFHLRIAHLCRSGRDLTLDGHNGLESESRRAIDHICGRPLRIEGHLNQARSVPKVEENDSAEV